MTVDRKGANALVTGALHGYIGSARWFGGKGRRFRVTEVRRLGSLGPAEDDMVTHLELATVTYDDGSTELYQVPLAYYRSPQDRLEHAFVGQWEDGARGSVFVYDALHDRQATALWLRAFSQRHSDRHLTFHRLDGHELDLDTHSALFSGEQSNSSVAFGEDCLMKVFRKVTPGPNPDIEIHEALTRAGSDHVAALYGWLEAPGPLHLAMLQQFLRTGSDGWELALASVRDLYAEADLHADEVGGDFAAESHRLGIALAEVHDTLRSCFPTAEWTKAELDALADAMHRRLDDAVSAVPRLVEHADDLRAALDDVRAVSEPVVVQRIHGDLHLGQTLRTVWGWKLVDFEGEPAKPLEERARLDSVWRDLAGMLRSFDYAAHAVESDLDENADEGSQIAYRAAEWAERNRRSFLDGYLETSERTEAGELTSDQVTLLRAYEVDKAVYETVYEARNRPEWISIPLGAIARLTGREEAPQV